MKHKISEIFVILFIIPTNRTSKHFFLAISAVISSNRARSWTWTFRQLIFSIFTYIISITLPFMTRFTKVSISPAKPLSNTTTEFTFELNEIFAMFWTVLNRNITTFRAYQLLSFERASCILRLIHCCHTILSASEIRTFALETHKIGIDDHSVIFRFSVVN